MLAVAVAAIAIAAIGAQVVRRQPSPSAASPGPQRNDLVGIPLTEEHANFTVASKNPDGSITLRDVTGPQQAEQAVRSNQNGTITNGREQGVER